MGDTTNRGFLGVVKLNLPLRVERVELAPLVFVPAFIITIYIVAFFASLVHVPARAKVENKPAPTGIKVNNTVAQDLQTELEDDFVLDVKGLEDMLPEMREWYQKNEDCVGWLKIDDMKIDYPIVQRKDDGLFYVTRNFEGNDDDTGSIVLDADDEIGTGLKAKDYQDGTKPSTNLIIGGHNMRNGTMFGDLDKFRDKSFTASHNIIKLNSLYEEREYEIVSVFLSQIYPADKDDVFKYYKFYEAGSKEEFDDFYKNIKKLQLFDTGVTAEYGDELLTLNTCTYHVEDGRMVVVAKRIK